MAKCVTKLSIAGDIAARQGFDNIFVHVDVGGRRKASCGRIVPYGPETPALEWSLLHHGTPSGITHTYEATVGNSMSVYIFQTDDTPPTPVILKASRLYKHLEFVYYAYSRGEDGIGAWFLGSLLGGDEQSMPPQCSPRFSPDGVIVGPPVYLSLKSLLEENP